jgi:hypothetical protein
MASKSSSVRYFYKLFCNLLVHIYYYSYTKCTKKVHNTEKDYFMIKNTLFYELALIFQKKTHIVQQKYTFLAQVSM